MTFDTSPVHGSSRSDAAFVSGKLARRIVVTAVALGLGAASAFAAEIQNQLTRYGVPWSKPASWSGGVVPGASDDVGFTEVCDFLYDANASGTVGSMSGKALTLTLARSLEVRDLYLLEGKIFDGGYNLKVTGTLTNVAKGYPQPGGGKRTGQGGNLDVANLSLGRASHYIFYPGDIIRSGYTAVLYQGWPDISVTQDPVKYANRLDKGLSFENEAPGAISLGPTSATDQAEITLNWDAGLSSPIDWTLRWKGNHETELRNYHANSQLKVGSLPTGKAFNPKDNIFFDSATGYTYVGFKVAAQGPTITVSAAASAPGGQIIATLTSGAGGNNEWIALAVVGAPLDQWVQPPNYAWVSTLTGTPRIWSVTMPTTPGTYEFRWFLDGVSYQLAAKSPPVEVLAPPAPTIVVSAPNSPPGGQITATIDNTPGGANHWMALALVDQPVAQYMTWVYVSSLSGTSKKTWSVTLPTIPGRYEFRLFLNNDFQLAAKSPPITVP